VSNDPRHHLGAAGEQLAAEHLSRRGFRIVERNYRTRWGELDIVGFDGRTLVLTNTR
jgi:putative endonuclease